MKYRKRSSRGMLFYDVVLTLAIAVVLLGAFTYTLSKQAQAQRRLAQTRTNARAVENAVLAALAGDALPANARIEKLPTDAPPGFAWHRIQLPVDNGSPAPLIALLPTGRPQP